MVTIHRPFHPNDDTAKRTYNFSTYTLIKVLLKFLRFLIIGMKPKLGVHVSMTKDKQVAGGNSFFFFFLDFVSLSWWMLKAVTGGHRGVHESIRVGFMPNPRPTRWHQVSDEKTHYRLQKPTGLVGSDQVGRQSGRLKLKICCQRFKLAATTSFLAGSSSDLSKTTRSKQNNTMSLPDLRKTHRILAKNYHIFVGFEKNAPDLCCIWVKPSNPVSRSWIWVKMRRSERKLVCFCRIGGRFGL